MNVLAKIVIPRTMLSIQYILETLEERAREDFYRLKKILDNKRKKKTKICNHEDILVTDCPVCLRMMDTKEVEEKCVICGALLHEEVTVQTEDEENVTKLEEFKEQIGELVEMTKEIEEKGIVSVSVEDFLKTAEQLKEKLGEKSVVEKLEPIPSDTLLEKLCGACKKRFEDEQASKNLPEETEQSLHKESVETVKSEKQLPEENVCELRTQMDTDLELGTFETEIQEIIKVIRVKNEDGSITEEKKVIRIKREIRAPIKPKPLPLPAPINTNKHASRIMYQTSEVSNKSNPFSDHKTVGVLMIRDSKKVRVQKAKSEVLECSSPMADPRVRSCISSMSFITLDSSKITFSFLSSAEILSVDKIRELTASSTNFEQILKLFELHTENSGPISTKNIELNENSHLTEPEKNLIASMADDTKKTKLKSKSNSNVIENVKNKVKKTISFNDKKKNDGESQSNDN